MIHATVKTYLFLFYFLFAIDTWSQIFRIPKYSSEFNVSHFYGLEKYIPIPISIPLHLFDLSKLICALLIANTILSFRLALQVSGKFEKQAVAFFFGIYYFISQISYSILKDIFLYVLSR